MSKKVTKNTKEFRQYAVGDPVLGKVRGYPPWPGIVVDPNEVPETVQSEQPPGKKSHFNCVLFFPMGDYAWLHPKDLSSLQRHEIESFLADDGKKRNGDLREGYRIALDPQEWMEEYQKRRAAVASREQEEEVDQLESEKEDGDAPVSGKKAKPPKKRKRDSDDEPVKPKKAPKPKKESAEPSKKKVTASAKSKKNGVKSKAMVESEDEGDQAEAEGEDESVGGKKTSPPPAKKAKRDKDDDGDDSKNPGDPQSIKVRDWRHKLQKIFLGGKTVPTAEGMEEATQLFTTVENYHEITIEQLQFSKIGKVMRHIAALPDDRLPSGDKNNFRERAKNLVERWHQILNANKGPNGSPTTSAFGHANGKSEMNDVTAGTKNMDLNGNNGLGGSPIHDPVAEAAVSGDADMSVLADITMSEA